MALIRHCDLCKEPLQTEWHQVTVTDFYGKRMGKQDTYDLCDACYKKLQTSASEIAFFERKD